MTLNLNTDRRGFLKTTAAAGAVATLAAAPRVHAKGQDLIKVGLVGCGGRGTGAAEQCVNAGENIKLVAMADMFDDRLQRCLNQLQRNGDKIDVPPERQFTGFDGYKQLLASDVDLVILATPPGFRPMHIRAVIEAGKHLFTEKPVAVDAPGIRSNLEMAELAKQKGLAGVAGTQRRHQNEYLESLQRIQDGEIGQVTSARCYWNQGLLWRYDRKPEWTDMEWQLRNWYYFTWLCGDHIVEQHVHNIDVCNWAIGEHPVKATGLGGRQVRDLPVWGHIFDHFAIDFEYPSGATVLSMCRQIDNCSKNVSEEITGTKGRWKSQGYTITDLKGERQWRWRGRKVNPYQQEHVDLIESIRSGQPLNELVNVTESTMSAIMGRMATYTGQTITWEQALNSKQSLVPETLAFGDIDVPPVAMPGITELI